MKYLFAVLLILFSSRAALAVDGQILINQATITTSGGFPYKITQPGSYKLSGNLAAPLNTAVILIQTSHVTLDLNGFNVACSWSPSAGFVSATCITDNFVQYTDITIRGGSITAIANAPTFVPGQSVIGLQLQSQGSTIEDIHFDALGSGYSYNGLSSGINSIVRRNTFTNNASPGVGCPSLVEENVNGTFGAGSNGTGCKYINNVGLFPSF